MFVNKLKTIAVRKTPLRSVFKRKFSAKCKTNVWTFDKSVEILNKSYSVDDWTNISPQLVSLIGRNLYLNKGNPIYLLSEAIRHFFRDFDCFVFDDPVVDLESNFDSLLIPKDHVSRQRSDTYYVNKDHVLRSHTSAHQRHCLEKRSTAFLCIADVYRRDEIDRRHHSVFHQCEAFRLYNASQVLNISSKTFKCLKHFILHSK